MTRSLAACTMRPWVLVFTVALVSSCAPKRSYNPVPVPAWEIVRELNPYGAAELSDRDRRDFDDAWASFLAGEFQLAEEELLRLRRRNPGAAQTAAALGFLEMRLGNRPRAETYFLDSLEIEPSLELAQAGAFLSAFTAREEDVAFERLRRLEADHPGHSLSMRYHSSLQLNLAESRLQAARSLMAEGRYEDAASAYRRALSVAPEAGALYVEAAEAELEGGDHEEAVSHARRAIVLEPDNASAHRVLGDALERAGELPSALEAYREAQALRPEDLEIRARVAELQRQYDREHFPGEYLDIPESERLSRQQLAALIFLKLRSGFESNEAEGSVIAIDIGESWASDFIRRVVQRDILEIYPNHTFRPDAYVTRSELAKALSATLSSLSPESFEAARASERLSESFVDLSPQNRNFDSAALAVSLGLLFPKEDGSFDGGAFVSGADAVQAVEALASHLGL